jgi:hypothetical protein
LALLLPKSPALARYTGTYVQLIRNNRKEFLLTKAKLEMLYLPVAIVLTLFNFSRIISTVVYVQYILMRTRTSKEFVEAIGELDNKISPTLNRIGLGGIYSKLKGVMVAVKNKLGGS